MTKILLVVVSLCMALHVSAQNKKVAIYDFVKVKDNRFEEALYYYEHNWKYYRDTAKAKKYISGYQLIKLEADTAAAFHLILVTEYPDSTAWRASEKNFAPILKKLRPQGPIYLNHLKADAFRQNVFFRKGEKVFSAGE
jgi:hypothetical protein